MISDPTGAFVRGWMDHLFPLANSTLFPEKPELIRGVVKGRHCVPSNDKNLIPHWYLLADTKSDCRQSQTRPGPRR